VIHDQIEKTTNSVVVHCFAGIERSVLTCAWYLCNHNGMSMDEAYKTVKKVRPVALDRREWARG
jgi:protein-tyrosine phosphatase